MPKQQRRSKSKDVIYYVPNKKKWIATSTKAISYFLAIIHEENPTLTINQIKEIISDRTKYIYYPEAIEVLDTHIKMGYGDWIPEWKY